MTARHFSIYKFIALLRPMTLGDIMRPSHHTSVISGSKGVLDSWQADLTNFNTKLIASSA